MEPIKQRIRQLRALLRRGRQSPEDAEDLIQEAFLRLHTFCQSENPAQQEAFLKRTVRNLAIDLHRKKHRDLYVQERPEELVLTDLRPTPDEDLATHERLLQVGMVLESLNARTREAFLMHRLEGYSCRQIAQAFGVSISAVEKHIARAVLALMDVAERQ